MPPISQTVTRQLRTSITNMATNKPTGDNYLWAVSY